MSKWENNKLKIIEMLFDNESWAVTTENEVVDCKKENCEKCIFEKICPSHRVVFDEGKRTEQNAKYTVEKVKWLVSHIEVKE